MNDRDFVRSIDTLIDFIYRAHVRGFRADEEGIRRDRTVVHEFEVDGIVCQVLDKEDNNGEI